MERLIILICRLNKSVTPTKYFFKVPLVGRLVPLVGVIGRSVESPLEAYRKESGGVEELVGALGRGMGWRRVGLACSAGH